MADSGVGATTRDVITDFATSTDEIDLMGIDADTTVAGNQAFRWVGTAALTGAGRARLLHLRRQHHHPRQHRRRRRGEFEIQLTGMQDADGRRLLLLIFAAPKFESNTRSQEERMMIIRTTILFAAALTTVMSDPPRAAKAPAARRPNSQPT